MIHTTRNIGIIVLVMLVLSTLFACGKVKEAAQVAKTVSDLAKTGEEMAESVSEEGEIDWESIELTEDDIRMFYSGVRQLNAKYPDIDFEVALVATMEAMSEGLNLQKEVEKETDMSFEEYSGLSTAIMLAQTESAGLLMTTEIVAAMEEGLAGINEADESAMTDEQKTAIEEQRRALAEAKAEIESPEFQARMKKAEMVNSIREEMGL